MSEREFSVCQWEYQNLEDAWETSCGEMFQFIADGPLKNGFKYCPYCGGKIFMVNETEQ